ncbi:Serine carboxypeptidase [Paramyrothecium foliicola]|nr:Serine carboxypeptidase [Paramyrothecium foliicola]
MREMCSLYGVFVGVLGLWAQFGFSELLSSKEKHGPEHRNIRRTCGKHKFLNEKTQGFAVNGSQVPELDWDIGESYAGSLPIDTENDSNQLFFWFFPSTKPTKDKEIVLWLSGGPGCSSVGELFYASGPISWLPGTMKPIPNEWSWHHETNVVWVDQPIGTGFSQGTVTARDTEDVARQFLGFWKNFLETFDLQGYKIYITGSSYSGQWSPYISSAMLDTNDKELHNVAGMMVHNGLYSQFSLTQDIPYLRHVERWNSVLGFNDSVMANLRSIAANCGLAAYIEEYLVFPPSGIQPSKIPGPTLVDGGYLPECDWYAVTEPALITSNPCRSLYNVLSRCPILHDPVGFSQGRGPELAPGSVYLDRSDVKTAIHAPESSRWRMCSSSPSFTNPINPLLNPGPGSMPVLPGVIERTQNVVLGSGLQDQITIPEGTLLTIQNLTFGERLGFQSEPDTPLYVPVRNGSENFGVRASSGTVGLWHKERGLTYFEAYGAGHSIGQDAPSVALRALEVLLGRVDYVVSLTLPMALQIIYPEISLAQGPPSNEIPPQQPPDSGTNAPDISITTHAENSEISLIPPSHLPIIAGDPAATFKDDVDAAREVVSKEINEGRDVVVIAHSYGGMVGNSAIKGFAKPRASTAASSPGSQDTERSPANHVLGLILIASGFTLTGLSFMDPFFGRPPPAWRVNKETGFADLVTPPHELFYHDLPAEESEYWVSQLTTQSLKALFEGGEHAYGGWQDVPVWYIGTIEDQGLPVLVQRMQVGMAREMGGQVVHRELQTSHSPFLSQPEETAEIITEAVEAFNEKFLMTDASGNFGTPITAALSKAGFDVTVITRLESTATFPSGLPVVKTPYTVEDLTKALAGQDAVVCAVGPAGISLQSTMVDAAEAAGVKRFIVDDFGWGPDFEGLPEFGAIRDQRAVGVDRARAHAAESKTFTWTSIATGNPIDWALKKFPLMGFDLSNKTAIIYDSGTASFTGTTLEGIGQAVVGVLQHPDETRNRAVKVMSTKTCQNDLLEAFKAVTGHEWTIQRSTIQELMAVGREKQQKGIRGWTLDLAVSQLLAEGQGLGRVAQSRDESDSDLLGVTALSPKDVVLKVLT